MDKWMRTDETLEAVFSLEMVCDQLPRAQHNIHYWKWVVIALHNALQGYMVLALRGSDGLNILTEKCAKKWKAVWKSGSGQFPPRRLDGFMNLYNKIQAGTEHYEEALSRGGVTWRTESDLMLMYAGSKPFRPQGSQTQSVEMLNALRNDFIHFLPKGLSLEVGGLPQMAKDCIDITAFLAFDCGNVLWHDPTLREKTVELLRQINVELEKMLNLTQDSNP
jgi:hypothetical protein